MAVFGVGTAPAMLLAGFSGSVLGQSARGRVLRVAAWCVVLTGALTIVRGTGVVTLPRSLDRPVCAFCR
jgi:sulfite exporter TauE/SafE